MTFEAYDQSVRLIQLLRAPATRLRSRNPELHRQLRRAASAVSLNLAEGSGREGADRRHHFRIARRAIEPVLPVLHRVLRLTRGLTR